MARPTVSFLLKIVLEQNCQKHRSPLPFLRFPFLSRTPTVEWCHLLINAHSWPTLLRIKLYVYSTIIIIILIPINNSLHQDGEKGVPTPQKEIRVPIDNGTDRDPRRACFFRNFLIGARVKFPRVPLRPISPPEGTVLGGVVAALYRRRKK